MSVAGERSGSWRCDPAIRGDTTPPLFEEILVITVKGDEKGELLEHQIWLISLNMTGLWG
jgi:hypothetical protein